MFERMEDGNEVFLISRRSKDGMEILVSKPCRSINGIDCKIPPEFRGNFTPKIRS